MPAMRSVHIDTARTWRGGQNQVLMTVTGLAEAGHQAILVAHEAGELRRRASEGLRFIGFSPRSEFDVHAGWQLARVLREIDPDVVHAHDPMAVSLAAMALQMRTGARRRPLVVASRRVDFHLKRHAFSKWKYGHVDVFIAASELIRSILVADGVPADRIEVVHDGVNVDHDRQAAGRGRARRVLAAQGRAARGQCRRARGAQGSAAPRRRGREGRARAARHALPDRRRGRAARAARAADPRPRPRSARRARRFPRRRARSHEVVRSVRDELGHRGPRVSDPRGDGVQPRRRRHASRRHSRGRR